MIEWLQWLMLIVLFSAVLFIACKTGSIGVHSGNVDRKSNAPAYWIGVSTSVFAVFVSFLLFLRAVFS